MIKLPPCSYTETIMKSIHERFESLYTIVPGCDCWIWTSSIGGEGKGKGHGRFMVNNVLMKAHRYSYRYYKGEIPDGMLVLHKCGMPQCVNPDHLYLGNHKDNARDSIKAGTHHKPVGEKNGNKKITEGIAQEILNLKGKRVQAKLLAEKYGISVWTVYEIWKSRRWKHLQPASPK